MKPKSKMNTKPQDEINTVLCAVAPTPKLSTDAIALEGAVVSRGNGIGATLDDYCPICRCEFTSELEFENQICWGCDFDLKNKAIFDQVK